MKDYGTDKSKMLADMIEAGHKPIAISIFLCEETFVFETENEAIKASEEFLPEGWYYGKDAFIPARVHYRNKFKRNNKVYWL